jgi:hypothetical protein
MPLLKVTCGNINLRNQSGQVRVFHSPRKGGKGEKEVFLDTAAKAGPTIAVISRIGSPHFFSSVPGLNADIVGRATSQVFDIAEGEIIKVFVDSRNNYGKRPTRASIYLRMRAAAASRILKFKITDHASAAFNEGEVEGNFDILTLDEVEAEGVKVLPQFRQYCSEAAVARAITSNVELAPEVAPVPKVKKVAVDDGTGTKKEVFVAARPRRVLGGS